MSGPTSIKRFLLLPALYRAMATFTALPASESVSMNDPIASMLSASSRKTWSTLQFHHVPCSRVSFPTCKCMAKTDQKVLLKLRDSASRSLSTIARAVTDSRSSSLLELDKYSSLTRKLSVKDVGYAGFMITIHALCLLAPFTFSWSAFGVFAVLYVTTGMLGITLSYHRNLSHRSFKLPKWLEYTLAYLGAQALQGDPIEWVSIHRSHHQHCDTDLDPHTPLEGFWHSHMGWVFDSSGVKSKVGQPVNNVKDLAKDPFYGFLARTYPIHPILLAMALYCLGGLPYVVWGMAVRIVWVYHITWFVNSAAHVWGSQQWNTGDLSRNNWWVALLAFGEGWHNNHHAFEYSARHGLEWWQLDMTWYTVKLLQVLGLATKVRLPSQEHKLKLAFPAE